MRFTEKELEIITAALWKVELKDLNKFFMNSITTIEVDESELETLKNRLMKWFKQ